MAFRELVSMSLTDMFVNELEKMILSGELKVGEKLPTERELASEMKVSLAVVNGGIRRLTELGFLRIAPRKGVFVADYKREGNINTLSAIVEYSGDYYNEELVSALAAFRRGFEASVTAEACEKCSAEDLAFIEKSVLAFCNEQDTGILGKLAFSIHHAIAAASGNVVYALMIATFRPIYISSYNAMLKLKRGREGSARFFIRLLECIREHDRESARTLVTESVDSWDETFRIAYKDGEVYNPSAKA